MSIAIFARSGRFAALALLLSVSFFVASSAFAGSGSLVPNAQGDGDLTLHVNFDTPPGPARLDAIKTAFVEASAILCDATDGQVLMRRVVFTGGDAGLAEADVRMVRHDCTSNSELAGLGVLGSAATMCFGQQTNGAVLAHELAHLAFGVSDQYPHGRHYGWSPEARDHGEFLCPVGPGFEAADMTPTRHTMMQGGSYWDCSQDPCVLTPASELSVRDNHDEVRGDPDGVCPEHVASTSVAIAQQVTLGRWAAPRVFDPTSFETAAESSHVSATIRLNDSVGRLLSPELWLFWTVEEPIRDGAQIVEDRILLVAAIDAGEVGGDWGDFQEAGRWTLDYSTGNLAVLAGGELRVLIDGLVSGADDLDIALDLSRHLGVPFEAFGEVELVTDGFMSCGLPDCAERWDPVTETWASTQHSLKYDFASDWEVLNAYFNFIEMPDGEPIAEPPPHCAQPPVFDEQFHGSNQTLLVLDRSGSMNEPAFGLPGTEVCANGLDDDEDGAVDEAGCVEGRLAFLQAAARALIDQQTNTDMDIGLVSFARDVDPMAPPAALDAATAAVYKGLVDQLQADGRTAIGDALAAARDQLLAPENEGRRQSVVLISDGMSNEGPEPEDVSPTLRDAGIQIYTIAAGGAADVETLGNLAAEGGGNAYPTESFDELHSLFAEIGAQLAGHGSLIERTRLAVAKEPWRFASKETEPVFEDALIELPVATSAKRLAVFLGGRNVRMATWAPAFELVSPTGQIFGPGSPELRVDPFYRMILVPAPEAGIWQLKLWSGDGELQKLVVTASVHRPELAFLGDVTPRRATAGETITLRASNRVNVPLDSDAVAVTARVTRPFGDDVPIDLIHDPRTGMWSGDFVADTRGTYTVTFRTEVADGARPIAGEPIFEGPERADVDVPAFERTTTASFVITDGPLQKCTTDDCDGDGVPNDKECKLDVDGDGWPSAFDSDADGDDTADGVEWLLDTDGDGISDACDPLYPKSK